MQYMVVYRSIVVEATMTAFFVDGSSFDTLQVSIHLLKQLYACLPYSKLQRPAHSACSKHSWQRHQEQFKYTYQALQKLPSCTVTMRLYPARSSLAQTLQQQDLMGLKALDVLHVSSAGIAL